MAKTIAFIDTEINLDGNRIADIGVIKEGNEKYHGNSIGEFSKFIADVEYLCGHNIIHHDVGFLNRSLGKKLPHRMIDTLYLSPLLFPKRPYHSLLKDDKLQVDQLNNPVNDSMKAQELFYSEINAFKELPEALKSIFYLLLCKKIEFCDFFAYIDYQKDAATHDVVQLIQKHFYGKICERAPLKEIAENNPVELAYNLALISSGDALSITPPWLLCNFSDMENIFRLLCGCICEEHCAFCSRFMDVNKGLKQYFGFDNFRIYNGEPLQEQAAHAAIEGKSLIAVFPTGGGKSIAFQVPALMEGRNLRGLTVIITPLLSLMKDQVDNLANAGINEAVTINAMLDPIARANALERIEDGSAKLLYISPEQLRSKTIERLLLKRNVVRFVIDEAHCFSSWGQDFRVDYLYIGDFIRRLQELKGIHSIPVSCFTATAKQKVISDISDYFKKKLNLHMELFATSAARTNLHYKVLFQESDEGKYNVLRGILGQKQCSTIVYVSNTELTERLAEKLTQDGFPAKSYHGKMEPDKKIANQEAFMSNDVSIIVATSAFGMGVDKKDVKLVVHYDISSSLEDYIQEAGRAGRDPQLQADCYVLFQNDDLDKHFMLLNQTKLSIGEIQNVWKAIKDMTRQRSSICCSPLEIARQAGWDDSVVDVETRVKTAVSALESAGYIKRGRNMPRIYASGINVPNMQNATVLIERSNLLDDSQIQSAKRIIKFLISSRANQGSLEAESRVDYIADRLGISREEVVSIVNFMRQDGILSDSCDMSAYILATDKLNRSMQVLHRFSNLENFFLNYLEKKDNDGFYVNLKELNEAAQAEGVDDSTVKNLRLLFNYYAIKRYVKKQDVKSEDDKDRARKYNFLRPFEWLRESYNIRMSICKFILEHLFKIADNDIVTLKDEKRVNFSVVGLHKEYQENVSVGLYQKEVTIKDIEDSLLYLSKIGAMKIEGGFLVLYNSMEIKRLELDNRIKYKKDDYRFLDEFYKQKIQQIHIVGEYANLMVRDYKKALQFVHDYFQMDYKKFINHYFKGEREKLINRNITSQKYDKLFASLSAIQKEIINDSDSKYIVVAAGPGSGKTRVLVHKLASLLLLEDVKHEQLLMLTFSRAAASEFKQRLKELIGSAAHYVEVKTFHSYCFDLLGKFGSLDNIDNVITKATEMIKNGEVESGKITKSVLVIDEAQDMDATDFELVKTLMNVNDEMRVIAVGDDDQNIYEFRGSSSEHFRSLINDYGAKKYEMVTNYRSKKGVVAMANAFIQRVSCRMKDALIESAYSDNGNVIVIRYNSTYIEEGLVEQLAKDCPKGSTCVLTRTNEEALNVLALLKCKNKNVRLIQSVDGFKLKNLLEVRYFLHYIDSELQAPVIEDDLWNRALVGLRRYAAVSECLEICENMFRTFAETYATKYRSDLEEFIEESKYEDFYKDNKNVIYISTIHKSKGREFDNVYLLCSNYQLRDDAERRALYVGITRAKNNLYIHCNNELFAGYTMPEVQHLLCNARYGEAKEIILQLGLRDVYLSYYKNNDKKQAIFKLRSGQKIVYKNGDAYVFCNGRTVYVAKLSRAAVANVAAKLARGYEVYDAKIGFIVAWKEKDAPSNAEEWAVLLPILYLKC